MISTPQFTRSVAANVAYWRQRTSDLSERKLGALDRERQNLYRATEFGLSLSVQQETGLQAVPGTTI